MFHLDDDALSESELDILEDCARVEPDGLIWFAGEKHSLFREKYNACEIYVQWRSKEFHGVQRIRVGYKEPWTRAEWRRRLRQPEPLGLDYMTTLGAHRIAQLRKVFRGEQLQCSVMGWRMLRIVYWQRGNAQKIEAAPAARVESESRNLLATMEKIPHEKKNPFRAKARNRHRWR